MKVLIAETGRPPKELSEAWPRYPEMFERMFERAGADFGYDIVDVESGEAIPDPEAGRALLVTGSPKGVYEGHDFIRPLEDAVRAHAEAGLPVLGICFGHQLVARAFGARVEKSERGWGVGIHTYEVVSEAPWGAGPHRFSCAVSHQDQVATLPRGFLRLAGSPFCPFGSLVHEELPILTFQMHPEFDHDYARALLTLRINQIPEEQSLLAKASLKNRSDQEDLGRWIRSYIEETLSEG